MNFESDAITDEWLEVTSRACFDSAVRQMARELLVRRDIERDRVKVPMPISRKRLDFLTQAPAGREGTLNPPCAADTLRHVYVASIGEEHALVHFALAHMDINQRLLGNEAPKETEPTEEPMQERARVVTTEEQRLFLGLLAIVKEGPNGPHKTAALILLGVEP